MIDITKMAQLLFGTYLAGHKVNTVGYRLPSLNEWEIGGVLDVGENARGQERHVPIPARGRPHAGFFHPVGNQDLTYEYGPYPPFGSDAAIQAGFNQCVTSTFATSITAHSPVSLLVQGGHGGRAGVTAGGTPVDTLRGAIVHYRGRKVTEVDVPSGAYKIRVTGIGNGPATLVLVSQTAHGTASKVLSFQVRRGESGTVSLDRGQIASTMRFAGKTVRGAGGEALTLHGLPSHLKHGAHTSLALTVRNQFGQPAPAVTVSLSGVRGGSGIRAVSDARGRVALTVDPQAAGRLTLRLSGPGYRSASFTVKVR